MASATGNPSNKTALKKGFGLMDWVKLTTSTKDLSGVQRMGGLRGYRLEEIKQHRSEHDAWAVFHGKVYNLTPYLHYHPGGADILIKSAGRDSSALFNKHHPWVNLEGLAGKLVIGYLIEEEEGGSSRSSSSSKITAGEAAAMKPSSSSSSSSSASSTAAPPPSSSTFSSMDPPALPPKRISISEMFGAQEEQAEEEETK